MKMEQTECFETLAYKIQTPGNYPKENTYLPMKMEQTECFETSEYKIQTPGNYPKENTYLPMKMEQTVFRNVVI
jgi:hypothetical protein